MQKESQPVKAEKLPLLQKQVAANGLDSFRKHLQKSKATLTQHIRQLEALVDDVDVQLGQLGVDSSLTTLDSGRC